MLSSDSDKWGPGPDNDWGCVGPDELFFSSGPTPSLLSLTERIECRDRIRRIIGSYDPIDGQLTEGEQNMEDGQLIVRSITKVGSVVVEGTDAAGHKIVKKSEIWTPRKFPDLKKVTFEVEKFIASNLVDHDERQTAEQRLVVSLGAKAPRRKAINYKKLKEQRAETKRMEGEAEIGGMGKMLRSLKGGKVKKSKGGKKKNGGGRIMKGKGSRK